MGKTSDLFKKIGDTKETFHAKMGMIKDRNGKDIEEAKQINKRWQEYTEELYIKGINDQETTLVWSFTQNRTSQSVKLSWPQEALL